MVPGDLGAIIRDEMILDLLILLSFVAWSVSTGFYFRRRASRGLEDYFLAGRTLRGWQAGLSMAATQYAADTPLLVTGLVAAAGIFAVWRLWVYGIAFLVLAFVLAPSWRRSGVITDAELTELRYGGRASSWLRALKAVYLGTLVNCTVLAMVLTAAARICEVFLPWHAWLPDGALQPLAGVMKSAGFLLTSLHESHPEAWIRSADNALSIILIVGFTWLYSATGGLRSVVSTDVVQFALMMAGTVVFAVFVLARVGGPGALPGELARRYGGEAARGILSFGPSGWKEGTGLFCTVLAVQWFAQVSADGSGYLAQRSMACRSDREAKLAGLTFSFVQVVFRSLAWLPIVVALLLVYPVESLPPLGRAPEAFAKAREVTFALGIKDLLPAGFRGLMLTGMLAALASTVDTHLNWGASYWTNDLYKAFLMERGLGRKPGPRELVWVARASNLGVLLLALWIGMFLGSIGAAWRVSLLFGAGMGLVLLLRWTWYRINVWSEFAAGGTALVAAPLLLFAFPSMEDGERMLWVTGLSAGVLLLVTLLTRPEKMETLLRFYRKVRPPGFWGAVARAAGEDPGRPRRALFRSLSAVILSSATLFSLLTGGGILLVQAPAKEGLLLPLSLLALGLLLAPLWWKLGMGERELQDRGEREARDTAE